MKGQMKMSSDKLPPPILITGAARSGTSMVAGAINLCGAFGGIMRKPNKYNEKGMFENDSIVNDIVKPYLRGIGMDPLGQFPLPNVNDLLIPVNWRERVEKAIKGEGYEGGPWFYKGAKMCLIWPIWHFAFPNAKWIIVRRRTGDIINSCINTPFMRAFRRQEFRNAVGAKTEEEGWLWWVREHEKRFIEMLETGLNAKIVWPHRMVSGDYEQLFETVDWLGLKWNSEVLSFIDPKLWKARRPLNGHRTNLRSRSL